MCRWERETGIPALHGVVTAKLAPNADLASEIGAVMTDPSRQTILGLGDRPLELLWSLSFVEATQTLFLSNFSFPHLIMCVGVEGDAKWCIYLSPGCCGGGPVSLATGVLVASSGCGGILTWIDPAGRVIHRTKPHEGEGLASAYGSRVRALSDGSCVVDEGPGVLSFAADGSPRWAWSEECSRFDYDEAFGLLVTAIWTNVDNKKTVSIACVKNLGALSART